MNFGLTFEINLSIEKRKLFIGLSDKLTNYFVRKNYGSDIEHLFIGVISVRPEFDQFFKIRKLKYKNIHKTKLLDGGIKELKCFVSYDIKLNFEDFVSVTNEESMNLLMNEIIKSLSNLDTLPKKVKNFDKDKFISDLMQFSKNQDHF